MLAFSAHFLTALHIYELYIGRICCAQHIRPIEVQRPLRFWFPNIFLAPSLTLPRNKPLVKGLDFVKTLRKN